jgi:hypothetical protein
MRARFNRFATSPRTLVPALIVSACPIAWGGAPAALNHVPADTAIYIAVPSVGGLLRDLQGLHRALAPKLPPEAAQIGMGLFLAQSVVMQPGVESDGSAAIILELPEGALAGGEPEFTVILPIADLEAFAAGPFMAGQNASIVDGVLTAGMPGGESFFIRQIGSHAVMSNEIDRVRAFAPGAHLATHEAALGASGLETMQGRDLVMVANIAALKPMLDEMMLQAEQQVNFLAMMGGGEQVTQGFASFRKAVGALQRDGSVWVSGLDIAADGVSIDTGAAFREDTESAAMFDAAGDTGAMLGALPETNFLLAYAFDASSPAVRTVVDKAMGMLMPGAGDDRFGVRALMNKATGLSGVIGASPIAFGGSGLLARQINYARTDDAPAAIAAMEGMIKGMHDRSATGSTFATTYDKGAAEVAGVKVDTYSVRTKADPGAATGGMMMMDPAMISNIMYGMTGGPEGFIAPGNGGVYTTSSKNSELLAGAFETGRGGASLAGNPRLRSVADKLQPNRIAEGYLAADQVYNAVAPLAQMLGMMDEFEPMPAMSPMGMSLRADQGGLFARVHMPADLLAQFADLAMKLQAMENEGWMDEGGLGDDDEGDGPEF